MHIFSAKSPERSAAPTLISNLYIGTTKCGIGNRQGLQFVKYPKCGPRGVHVPPGHQSLYYFIQSHHLLTTTAAHSFQIKGRAYMAITRGLSPHMMVFHLHQQQKDKGSE